MQTAAMTVAPFTAVKVSARAPRTGAVRVAAAACPAEAPPLRRAGELGQKLASGAAAVLGSFLIASQPASAGQFTYDQLQALSYLEVKGSGLANQCPTLGSDADDGTGSLVPGSYTMDKFCMEPSAFKIKVVGSDEFEKSTLLTRNTYSLDQMSGSMVVSPDGTLQLIEEGGVDFAPVTVKIRGGEMVPFMFTVKNMQLKGPGDGFGGSFDVPSYRGATFMDPQGRGAASGWEYTKGLQAAGAQESLEAENKKNATATRGEAVFAVAKVDPVTREVAGVFLTRQLADDDLGSKDPATVQIEGTWYAQLS